MKNSYTTYRNNNHFEKFDKYPMKRSPTLYENEGNITPENLYIVQSQSPYLFLDKTENQQELIRTSSTETMNMKYQNNRNPILSKSSVDLNNVKSIENIPKLHLASIYGNITIWNPTNKIKPDSVYFDKTGQRINSPIYLEEYEADRRRRRRRWCPCFGEFCTPCCLCLCLLMTLLLAALIGLIVALVLSLTANSTTLSTTQGSTTTVTTSTTTTTTTTTVSTATTTTTATTSTTVTTATTTTTSVTTASITSNLCTAGWSGITQYTICTTCPQMNPYRQFSYTYTAISNRTRITIAMREDYNYFGLDDVSVRSAAAPGVELLSNGGFETGSLSSWSYCNPSNANYSGTISSNSPNFVFNGTTFGPRTGNYYYLDGAVGNVDYLSQTFSSVIGQTYNISFWIFHSVFIINNEVSLIVGI